MKAKDWKFDKYLPDSEDVEAACNASEAYFNLPPIKGRNEGTTIVDAFHSGFTRGIAWAIAKLNIDEKLQSNIETHIEMLMEPEELKKIGADKLPHRDLHQRVLRIFSALYNENEQLKNSLGLNNGENQNEV